MKEKGGAGNAGCGDGGDVRESCQVPLFPRISSSGEALRVGDDYSCCGVALVFARPLALAQPRASVSRRHFPPFTSFSGSVTPVCRERGLYDCVTHVEQKEIADVSRV
jgi:hypothetical protein